MRFIGLRTRAYHRMNPMATTPMQKGIRKAVFWTKFPVPMVVRMVQAAARIPGRGQASALGRPCPEKAGTDRWRAPAVNGNMMVGGRADTSFPRPVDSSREREIVQFFLNNSAPL